MMAHKMVIHVGNYKRGSVGALERHNLRENETYSNPDIDQERTKDNQVLKRPRKTQYQDTRELIESRATNQVRSTSIWQSEFIISSDQEFFNEMSLEEQNRFFREAYNYLAGDFGERNTICSVVHYDESTPHMHFDLVPMTAEDKLSRKEVMTRERLIRIQEELPQYMQEKGFDIERGRKMAQIDEKDRPKHIEPKEYKRALQGQIEVLEGRKKALQAEQKKVLAAEKDLAAKQGALREKVLDHNGQIKSLQELPRGEKTITGKVSLLEQDYQKLVATAKNGIILAADNREMKQKIGKLTEENASLAARIPTMKESLEQKKQLAAAERAVRQNVDMKETLRKLGEMELPAPAKKLIKSVLERIQEHAKGREQDGKFDR